jgi:hypothetical protein
MQITSGRVVYKRTIQPAQFESKSAEIELSFSLAEGEELGDAIVDTMEAAKEEVLLTLGLIKLKEK